MDFYFCETCGKRLTEYDIAGGVAKDKKLKGVFCKACAVGVSTTEALPLSVEASRELLAKEQQESAREGPQPSSKQRIDALRPAPSMARRLTWSISAGMFLTLGLAVLFKEDLKPEKEGGGKKNETKTVNPLRQEYRIAAEGPPSKFSKPSPSNRDPAKKVSRDPPLSIPGSQDKKQAAKGGVQDKNPKGAQSRDAAKSMPVPHPPSKSAVEAKRKADLAHARASLSKLQAEVLVMRARNTLAPLLKKSLLEKAIEALNAFETRSKPSPLGRKRLAGERADLEALIALRSEVFAVLKKRIGKPLQVHLGKTLIAGTLVPEKHPQRLGLKIKEGPQMRLSQDQLALKDIARYAAKFGESKKMERHRRLGLLQLVLGDFDAARKHFEKAATLGGVVAPYLERLKGALSESEAQANMLWFEGEVQFYSQQWREALNILQELEKNFSESKVLRDRRERLVRRKRKLLLKLNLIKPGLAATYFRGTLLGSGQVLLKRIESNVDFSLNTASPHAKVPGDYWSARWTGYLLIEDGGEYFLGVNSDNGHRLWIDGKLLLDHWVDQSLTKKVGVSLCEGLHPIRLEYCEFQGAARCQLNWSRKGSFEARAVGSKALFHDSRER